MGILAPLFPTTPRFADWVGICMFVLIILPERSAQGPRVLKFDYFVDKEPVTLDPVPFDEINDAVDIV